MFRTKIALIFVTLSFAFVGSVSLDDNVPTSHWGSFDDTTEEVT